MHRRTAYNTYCNIEQDINRPNVRRGTVAEEMFSFGPGLSYTVFSSKPSTCSLLYYREVSGQRCLSRYCRVRQQCMALLMMFVQSLIVSTRESH